MNPTRRSILQVLAGSALLVGSRGGRAEPELAPAAAPPNAQTAGARRGTMTFVINVHEWGHLASSAAVLTDLCQLYDRYGVKGDFYLTGPMAIRLAAEFPSTVAAMAKHGISYHVRAPHPLATGFGAPLAGLTGDALTAAIRDYETFDQDLATGALDRSRSGGFTAVSQVFGRPPCVVGMQAEGQDVRNSAAAVYKELGARMIVAFHEGKSDPDRPLERKYDLLVRPSHLPLTRTADNNFWWNAVAAGRGGNPTESLKASLDGWKHTQLPYVVGIIHENNFYKSGPEAWTSVYYTDAQKSGIRSPPYDLAAPDWGKARPAEGKARIWAAYSELVAWCAAEMNVVTGDDIVHIAG